MAKFIVLAALAFAALFSNVDAQCRCAPQKFCNTEWKAVVKITAAHMSAENRLREDYKYEVVKYISEEEIPKTGVFGTPISLAACGMPLVEGQEYLMGGLIDESIPRDGKNVTPKTILKFCHAYASPLSSAHLINKSLTLKELCPQ